MKIDIRKSFEKDVLAINDKKLAKQIKQTITDLELCESIAAVPHVKKMAGKGGYFRIRIGHYRMGFKLEGDTILLLRLMHRKEI